MAKSSFIDSWRVWRRKIDGILSAINPSAIAQMAEDISTLKGKVSFLETQVGTNTTDIGNIKTQLDATGDVLNSIYPLIALGDVTMYENMKSILDNIDSE